MIQLITNVPGFTNDIAEEIRLFLGMVEISSDAVEDPEFSCEILFQNNAAVCTLTPFQVNSSVKVQEYSDALDKKRQEKRAVKLAVYRAMQQVFTVETPWGSLTGIRPTKLFRDIAARSSEEEASLQFSEIFSVRPDKLSLVEAIHRVQKPIISSVTGKIADIYFGVPYCKTRCLYCSFGSEVSKSRNQLKEYLFHFKSEIAASAAILKKYGFTVRSAYFGGGTPTVFCEEDLHELLSFIEEQYSGLKNKEFTVEAGRPDTITPEKLKILRAHGVTRISINPQTMNEKTLHLIGRSHSAESVYTCFQNAREAGFENINMDTIAGLPGETLSDFRYTLDEIMKLGPESLTVHTLAIKKSSRLKDKLAEYPLPRPETTEKMVAAGAEAARSLKMQPYYMYRQKYMNGNLENVGYCLPGFECIYNIDMMEETVTVMAHGANTITKRVFGGENRVERIANPKNVPTYFEKLPLILENKDRFFGN